MQSARKTKILLAIITVTLLAVSFTPAKENHQKIYPLDSQEYLLLTGLCVETGTAIPSSSGPWSESELLKTFYQIPEGRLNSAQQKVYLWLENRFLTKELKVNTEIFASTSNYLISPELYAHTSSDEAYDEEDEWFEGYDERAPLVSIPLEMWGDDFIYGFQEFTLQNTRYYTGTESTSGFYSDQLNTNIIFDTAATNVDVSFPHRAFISVGNNTTSIQFGRDTLSWGHGITGNLILTDNLTYNEFIKAKLFYEPFTYTFLTIGFPHPEMYIRPALLPDSEDWIASDLQTGTHMFIAHRYELKPFDALRISITEGIMYLGESIDLRFFSPFTVLHNYYMKENSNSIMSFEFDYTPGVSLQFHGQFAIDDLSLGNEAANAQPDAWAVLGNIQYFKTLNSGMLNISLEGVYTTPYMYLRNSRVFDGLDPAKLVEDQHAQPINYIVAYPQYIQGIGNVYHREFLGYPYGGDAIVLNLSASLTSLDTWKVYSSIFTMMHGINDMDTVYELGDSSLAQTPTTTSFTDNNITDKNSIMYSLVISAGGDLQINEFSRVSAEAAWLTTINPGNKEGDKPLYDLQVRAGCTIAL